MSEMAEEEHTPKVIQFQYFQEPELDKVPYPKEHIVMPKLTKKEENVILEMEKSQKLKKEVKAIHVR